MELLKCVISEEDENSSRCCRHMATKPRSPRNVAEYKWRVVFLYKLDDRDLKIVYYVNSILVIKLFSNLGDIMRHSFLLSASGIFINPDSYKYKTYSN